LNIRTTPIATISQDIPGFVAAMLEEYGKDSPRASKQELIVFALELDRALVTSSNIVLSGYSRIHPPTSACTRTCMLDNVQTLFI
jgi:hypothetical protein